MATYQLLHLGREIEVDTFEREPGHWCWRYSIDNGEPRECTGSSLTDENFARQEAEKRAVEEIDRYV